jgi:hypothetical protein
MLRSKLTGELQIRVLMENSVIQWKFSLYNDQSTAQL